MTSVLSTSPEFANADGDLAISPTPLGEDLLDFQAKIDSSSDYFRISS